MISFLLTVQLILWLGIFWVFVRSPSASIFHPFTWYLIFHGLVFVIRPIVGRIFDFERMYYLMAFYPSDGEIEFTIALTFVGLLFMALATAIAASTVPSFDRPVQVGVDKAERRAFAVLLQLSVPLGLYSAATDFLSSAGSAANPLFQMTTDAATGATLYVNTTGYFVGFQVVLGTICLMLIWMKEFRPWTFAPLCLYLLDRVFIGHERWTIVLTLLSLGLLHLVHGRRRWFSKAFIIVGIPTFIVFQLMGEERDVFRNWISGNETPAVNLLADQSWIERQDNPDFANFEFLTYLVDIVPEKTGTYGYFGDFLQLFTEPIPRVLWPDKPVGSPVQLLDVNAYGNFVGWTYSLVGMGWVSLGWVGVGLLMTIVGSILGLAHRWYWSGEASNYRIITYCLFLPLTLQWFRDGDISIAKFVLFTLGPVFLWRGLIKVLTSPAFAILHPVAAIAPGAQDSGDLDRG